MVSIRKHLVIDGESFIGETKAATFRATINCDDPENVRFTVLKNDEKLYKENRKTIREDEAEFEDVVYDIQDRLIPENIG